MQPPITRYKDEAVEETNSMDTTMAVLNQEIEKEAKKTSEESSSPKTSVKLDVLPVKKSEKKTNASNIVNAFRQKMSTSSTPIELPSVGKTVEFKEISGSEQKEMSKIAFENDSRADIMYCAMLSMINRLAVDKGFDIRDYTEFERISIILNLQQMNKINPEIKYTCSTCGKENSYRLDTQKLLRNFSKTYCPDKEFEIEYGPRKFMFKAGWPCVRNVEDFFKNYYKKYDNSSKSVKDSMNNLSQIEYITMFIKSVAVEELSDESDKMTANLEELTYAERVQIIDCLPQSVIFDDENGVISKIIDSFVNQMNESFKYRDCSFCGAEQKGALANVTDFLGY